MTGRRISSANRPRPNAATLLPGAARVVRAAAAAAAASLCFAAAIQGQGIPTPSDPGPEVGGGDGWNSEAALLLADRAIAARRHAWADSTLQRFRADVQGHVYYIGDFLGERHVIRADQLALDVRWQNPDRTMQTIVGRRHELRLPTTVAYHLDHLFLILDNFGDRIRLGDGLEIRNVLHPAADGARTFYEYRLADSLEIRLRDRTARVFELEVRPREAADAGAVGSLFGQGCTSGRSSMSDGSIMTPSGIGTPRQASSIDMPPGPALEAPSANSRKSAGCMRLDGDCARST